MGTWLEPEQPCPTLPLRGSCNRALAGGRSGLVGVRGMTRRVSVGR